MRCGGLFAKVLLIIIIIAQSVILYHTVFQDWRGPGDFGNNYNYVPAIMIGLGKGFTRLDFDTIQTIPSLKAFIDFETMQLVPAALPEELSIIAPDKEDELYRYMLYTVGCLWRIFGISWTVVRVLCVVVLLFTACIVYGISRYFMPALWSLFVAHAFTWNFGVLSTLNSSFRDFSKAFFVLLVVFVLGGLINKPSSRKRYLGAAAIMGIILGLGMGFRRDMQAVLPLALLVMSTCRLQPIRFPHLWRFAAVILAIVMFVCVSFPVLRALYPQRWLNAHDAIMGFSTVSDASVGVLEPASFEKHYLLNDSYCSYRVQAFAQYKLLPGETTWAKFIARHVPPGSESLHLYAVSTVLRFPADFLARAYGAVLSATTGNEGTNFPMFGYFDYYGVFLVGFGLILIAMARPYQALQILLLLCLFAGYTSIQFGIRHAFHTSFAPYLFGCFVFYRIVECFKERKEIFRRFHARKFARAVFRTSCIVFVVALCFIAPLNVARHFQRRNVSSLLDRYTNASRIALPYTVIPNYEGRILLCPVIEEPCPAREDISAPSFEVSVYVARFAASATPLEIDLVYDWYNPGDDMSGPMLCHVNEDMETGEVAFYFPVYEVVNKQNWNVFTGIRVPEHQARDFLGFEKLSDVSNLGYLLNLTVPLNQEAFVTAQTVRFPFPRDARFHDAYRYTFLHLRSNDLQIRNHLSNKQSDKAIEIIHDVLSRRPGSIQFNALLAWAYFEADRSEDAWSVIGEMLRSHPDSSRLFQRLNMLFMDVDGIEACYQGWLRITTRYPDACCAMPFFERAKVIVAESSLSASEFERYRVLMWAHPEFEQGALLGDAWFDDVHADGSARVAFWRELSIAHPGASLPQLRLGIALEAAGDFVGATGAYANAYTNDSRNAEAAIRYALSPYHDLKSEVVDMMLSKALLIGPGLSAFVVDCLEQWADRAATDCRHVEAEMQYRRIAHYLDSLDDSRRAMGLRFRPAEMLAEQGLISEALDELHQLLVAYPDHEPGLDFTDALLLSNMTLEYRIAFWRSIVRSQPRGVYSWIRLGQVLEEAGYIEEGASAFRSACVNAPENSYALIRYATALSEEIHDDERIRSIDVLVRRHPEEIGLVYSYFARSAYYYSGREEYKLATRFFLLAARYAPENPQPRFEAARAYRRMGALEEAQSHMKSLLMDEDLEKSPEIEVALRTELFLLDDENITPPLDVFLSQAQPDHTKNAQRQLIEAAETMLGQRRYNAAERTARMAISVLSETEEAWLVLVRALRAQGRMAEAIETLQTSVGAALDIEQLVEELFTLLVGDKDKAAAVEVFQRLAARYPDSLTIGMYHAHALEVQGQWRAAIDVYERLITDFPEEALVALRLGIANAYIGEVDMAIGLIERAVAHDAMLREQATVALRPAIQALLQDNALASSERLGQLMVGLTQGSAEALLQQAEVLMAMDQRNEAVSVLTRAVSALDHCFSIEAARHIDTLLSGAERLALWHDMFEQIQYRENAGESLFVTIHYAKAIADAGNTNRALTMLEDILEKHPENYHARLTMGILLCSQGNTEKGTQYIETALPKYPAFFSDTLKRLEEVVENLLAEQKYSHAEAVANLLRTLSPENPLYSFFLGQAFLGQSRYREAVEQFSYVLLRAPESPRSAEMMDRAFCHIGASDERYRAWQRIADAHPEAQIPRLHLAVGICEQP